MNLVMQIKTLMLISLHNKEEEEVVKNKSKIELTRKNEMPQSGRKTIRYKQSHSLL